MALYARIVLNIRTVANYLLARIADTPECRPYLKKYFAKATNIPSDLLEIADLYAKIVSYSVGSPHSNFQKPGRNAKNRCALPVCLRRVITDKFSEFDEYQLAKYNKKQRKPRKKKDDGKTKRKVIVKRFNNKQQRPQRAAKPVDPNAMTLKRLIRQLHIQKPAELVMSIVGKK